MSRQPGRPMARASLFCAWRKVPRRAWWRRRRAAANGKWRIAQRLPMRSSLARQVTSAEGSDVAPAWSPDGASVAFLRVEEGAAACMVAPATGGGERKVADCATAPDAEQPRPAVAWMADGRSLVVAAPGQNQLPGIALVPAR